MRSSHRRNGATNHATEISWLYRSPSQLALWGNTWSLGFVYLPQRMPSSTLLVLISRMDWPYLCVYIVPFWRIRHRGQCLLSIFFTLLPPNQPPRWCLSPTCISLLLTNTVSSVRACLSIWYERFRGNQKNQTIEPGPRSIQSSLVDAMQRIYFLFYVYFLTG